MRMRTSQLFLAVALLVSVLGCGVIEDTLSISSISPSAGSSDGGTEVTINGRGFTSSMTVTFGGRTAPQREATTTKLVVTAPSNANETGSVDVVITGAGGESVTRVGGYTYISMLASANRDSTDIGLFNVNRVQQSMGVFFNSPFASQGTAPRGIDSDTTNGFLFVTNGNSNTVSVFSYSQAEGTLTVVTDSPFAVNSVGPVAIALDTTLRLAFTANFSSGTVSAFTYDADTGAMTFVNTTDTGPSGLGPIDVEIDTALRLIFVSNSDAASNTISVFTYESDGTLTEVVGSPFAAGGTFPALMAVDSVRRLLFVAIEASDIVAVKSFDNDGVLTDITTFNPNGTGPYDIVLDTSSRFIFITNRDDDTVGSFLYSADGSTIASTGLAGDSGGIDPVALEIDMANDTLFVANAGSNDIQIMNYDASGILAQVGSVVASGGLAPYGLEFIP